MINNDGFWRWLVVSNTEFEASCHLEAHFIHSRVIELTANYINNNINESLPEYLNELMNFVTNTRALRHISLITWEEKKQHI